VGVTDLLLSVLGQGEVDQHVFELLDPEVGELVLNEEEYGRLDEVRRRNGLGGWFADSERTDGPCRRKRGPPWRRRRGEERRFGAHGRADEPSGCRWRAGGGGETRGAAGVGENF
jgi:hypothetical protein